MNKKELQLLSVVTITKSNLPKDAKIQLLNFVQKEATKHQLMVFMMDGKIERVSPVSESIIEDRFHVIFEKKMNTVQQGVAKCKQTDDFKGCMKQFFKDLRSGKVTGKKAGEDKK